MKKKFVEIPVYYPFNPESDFLCLRTIAPTILEIQTKIKKGKIVLSNLNKPITIQQKSKIVESVILGFHIDAPYLFEVKENQYVPIDGVQIILAIMDFISEKFKLTDLKSLWMLNDSKFSTLPVILSRKIEVFKLKMLIIPSITPLAVVYDMIERRNTKLSRHQLRQKLYPNAVKFLETVAETNEFKDILMKYPSKSLLNHEALLRLIANIEYPNSTGFFEPYNLEIFLDNAMKKLNFEVDEKKRQIIRKFKYYINRVHQLFGDFGFSNPEISSAYNPALVESLCFFVLSQSESFLYYQRGSIKEVFHTKLLTNEKFRTITNLDLERPESVDYVQHLHQRVTLPKTIFLENCK